VKKNWALKSFGFLIILGSIIFVPLPSFGFVLPKLLLFSSAALAGALTVVFTEKHESLAPLFKTGTGRLFLLFFIIVLLSQNWSKAPLLSIVGAPPRFEGLLAYFIFFSLALTTFALARKKKTQSFIVDVIIWSNAIVIFYGALQMIGMDPFAGAWESELFLGRAFSTLGQPNFLGLFILLTFPFVFVRRTKPITSTLCLLNLFVLAGTASRSAYAGFFAVLLICLFTHKRRRPLPSATNKPVFIATSITLILIALLSALTLAERFSFPTQDTGLGSRYVIWKTSSNMIIRRPIGYGLDTMALYSPKFVTKEIFEYEPLETAVDRAHSKPLDLLFTLGIPGLIAYYLLLAAHLTSIWKKRSNPLLFASFVF